MKIYTTLLKRYVDFILYKDNFRLNLSSFVKLKKKVLKRIRKIVSSDEKFV